MHHRKSLAIREGLEETRLASVCKSAVFWCVEPVASATRASRSAAATELQALVIAKFIEASENYISEDTKENQSKEKTIGDWLSSAHSEVLELQQSKAYLNAQKKYVTSLTKFQKAYRALLEDFQVLNHLPTQSEIDDISKGLHDLKKEVRTLKSQLNKRKE